MIISLTGTPGSGKSTLAQMLTEKLGLKRFYMGGMRRKMAQDKGMTLEELNSLGEKEDFTDRDVDEYQEKLGKTEDNFVIEGRTSYHFIPHSIKIMLTVELEEGARRIFEEPKENKAKRNEREYSSVEDVKEEIKERIESDRKRYKKYYDIDDCYAEENFDLILDTTKLNPEQVLEKVVDFVKSFEH